MLTSALEQISACLLRRGMPTIFRHMGNFQLALTCVGPRAVGVEEPRGRVRVPRTPGSRS
jgi:hypothetical protein